MRAKRLQRRKIDFDGNVVILGTVLDGSSIKATGSVEVHGSILCSTIIAERGVFVTKAIVGSQVLIGQSIFVLAKLHAMIKECLDLFHRFRAEYIEGAKSGDSIVVRGTVRGSSLVAENLIRICALGTETGTESSVRVSHPSGQITLGIRYPNTLLQVGSIRHRNVETSRNVVFRGDDYADKNTSRRRFA